jgi:hypothetical protein
VWIGDLFDVSKVFGFWYQVERISTLGLEGWSEENMMSRGIVRVDEDVMLCCVGEVKSSGLWSNPALPPSQMPRDGNNSFDDVVLMVCRCFFWYLHTCSSTIH